MDEQQRTWTSEEALANLESLTKLDWDRNELPEGVGELLQTYEVAIPQLAAEIRLLRGKLREVMDEGPDDEASEGRESETSDGYEDLANFARRLGFEQR